jgi:hypothetical protein
VDVEVVRVELGVLHESLDGRAADLGVGAPVLVEEPHLELVEDVVDPGRPARVRHRGAILGEAADRATECDDPVVCLDGDLIGERKPPVI